MFLNGERCQETKSQNLKQCHRCGAIRCKKHLDFYTWEEKVWCYDPQKPYHGYSIRELFGTHCQIEVGAQLEFNFNG